MDEKRSTDDPKSDEEALKVYKKQSDEMYAKRMAERSLLMKRMSSKSSSDKAKGTSIVGKRPTATSKETMVKAIERKVTEMSDSHKPTLSKHDSYVPEKARKTIEERLEDLSNLEKRKSSKVSSFSDRRRTLASQLTAAEGEQPDGLYLTKSEKAIVEADNIPEELDLEYDKKSKSGKKSRSKSRDFNRSLSQKISEESNIGQRDIENILEAIKPVDMPTTESEVVLVSASKIGKQQSVIIATEEGQKSGNDTDSDEQNISELNFRISDMELSQLIKQTSMRHVTKHIIHSRTDYMPLPEFERVVKNLYKCCLKSVTDLHELHLRRMLALPLINDIVARADPEYISTAHIVHMVWSVMSCVHHFQLRLKSGSNRLVMYTRQRMVDKCMDHYLQLIRMFKPTVHRIILSAIITFYKDGKLWDIEFACTDMIVALLDIYPDVEDGVNDLLNSAMYSTSVNPVEAQKLMQVIYEVLRLVKWRKISRKIIDRMLFMLESSISSKEDNLYAPLRMGMDLCIRHVISNISNRDVMIVLKRLLKKMVEREATEESVMCFGSLAMYAAAMYQTKSFHSNVTPDLLFYISILAHEESKIAFLTATRIWLNLIDRNKNSSKLNRPRIFFRGCQYDIMVKKKSTRHDRMFFKANRNYFYELITDCFKTCSDSRIKMYAIFEMCAVILVEIPCGYTAATFTSIAISMQEYALRIYTENLVNSNYLHATALSILSLICYVHQAEVFYQYVANIIDRRAEWAPHLIPPLKSKYEYALHHVLWNKPELFFEDWEARFGLWKCFRIKKKKRIKLT